MAAMTAKRNQMQHSPKNSAAEMASASQPMQTLIQTARDYARENPEAAALWCFGIGFVLGWKLKLW